MSISIAETHYEIVPITETQHEFVEGLIINWIIVLLGRMRASIYSPKAYYDYTCMHCSGIIKRGEVYHFLKTYNHALGGNIIIRTHKHCANAFYDRLQRMQDNTEHWEKWYDEIFV